MSYQERRAERFGERIPNLQETIGLLTDEFLSPANDPLRIWNVTPDFDVEWAKALVKELANLSVCLPPKSEEFLAKSVVGDNDYRIRWRAAISVLLIGLKIPKIRHKDEKRRLKFDHSPDIYALADQLELGQLNPQNLL